MPLDKKSFEEKYIEWYTKHNMEMKDWENAKVDAAVASKSGAVDDHISNLMGECDC